MKVERTHDRIYLDEYYKVNPKEYFKLVFNEMKKDWGGKKVQHRIKKSLGYWMRNGRIFILSQG